MEFLGTVIILVLYALLFASFFWRKFAKYLVLCISFQNLHYLSFCILQRTHSVSSIILSFFVLLTPIPLTVDLKLTLKNTLFELICSCLILLTIKRSEALDLDKGPANIIMRTILLLLRAIGCYIYDLIWQR